MPLINKHLVKTAGQKSSMILDLLQSLSLIVAAQLLIHGILISYFKDELVLLPMLSSSGLLDLAFAILVACSVISVVRHSSQEQVKNQSPNLQLQTEGN